MICAALTRKTQYIFELNFEFLFLNYLFFHDLWRYVVLVLTYLTQLKDLHYEV